MTPADVIPQMFTVTGQDGAGPLFGVTPDTECAYLWSRRLWELERVADPAGAKNRHVGRMRQLESVIHGLRSTELEKLATTFYRLEAENLNGRICMKLIELTLIDGKSKLWVNPSEVSTVSVNTRANAS